MPAEAFEAGSSRRLGYIRDLDEFEAQLRELSNAPRENAWYASIGELLSKFEGIYDKLGTVGFLTEGRELHGHRTKVLEAVAPLVVPDICDGGSTEVCEWAARIGVDAKPDSKARKNAGVQFVKAVLEMADRVKRVRSYLANREEAVASRKTAQELNETPDSAGAASHATPQGSAPGLAGAIDPLRIAAIARNTAEHIERIPHLMADITESDPWPDLETVRERLNPLGIAVDFIPAALYIERNWTPEHARKLVGQIHKVTDTVEDFLRLYQSITTTHSRDTLMWHREEGMAFLVMCMMISQEVFQWASEIEDRARRSGTAPDPTGPGVRTSPAPALRRWTPPSGYVGRKAVCHEVRFRKNGKNPSATTIDVWVKAAEREGKPVKIEKAPDTGENHYPEAWILDQICTWNPRANKRNPST